MVKAFSYGSGGYEIANVLQFHKLDYLAVAYADEGVELRKGGILLPIMVMNTDSSTFDLLVKYQLEPEVYSPGVLRGFGKFFEEQKYRSVFRSYRVGNRNASFGFFRRGDCLLCWRV